MRSWAFSGYALGISFTAALLCACGRSSMPISPTDSASGDAGARTHSMTFDYTGSEQTFIVPARVKQLTVSARGSAWLESAAAPDDAAPVELFALPAAGELCGLDDEVFVAEPAEVPCAVEAEAGEEVLCVLGDGVEPDADSRRRDWASEVETASWAF